MCFSATASFTAGAALTVIGVASVASVKRRSDILFAAIPLLFGLQQLLEGVIWLSLQNTKLVSILSVAYLFVSHVVWPTVIPLSVFLMERVTWRRRVLGVCIGVGIVVSAYFLYYLFIEPVTAIIVDKCIAYVSQHFSRTFFLSPYTLATSLSCLFSRYRLVNLFGITTFIAGVITVWFYDQAFISVWCFFAAILSVIIFMQVRLEGKKSLR